MLTDGATSVIIGALAGKLDIVRMLIDRGAIFDAQWSDLQGVMLLYCAATYGNVKIAELLLELGANVNSVTVHGQTPLLIACQMGHPQLVNLLISEGVCTTEKEVTPLDAAAMIDDFIDDYRRTNTEVAKLLVENGANVNAKMHTGGTRIFWAAFYGDIEIVTLLLSKGAETNHITIYGTTLLHYAVNGSSLEIVKLVAEKNIDLWYKSDQGETALDLAVRKDKHDIVNFLTELNLDAGCC